jgi:LysM repeat protein
MKSGKRYGIVLVALLVLLVGSGSPLWGTAVAARQGSGSVIHIVQWGETLTLIARRYGVSTAAIVQANGLANPNYIYAGQRLVIPSPVQPPTGGTSTYVVCAGDTLSAIALRFGTTVSAIVSLNCLMNPNLIYPGQVLQIPGYQPPAGATGTCVYVVKPGDNLTRIALAHGTTVWALAIANNLANPSFIWVGQRLVIPSCSVGPTPTPVPGQPTATPTRTPTPTPKPATPTPTSTPKQAYEFRLVQGPTKDPCHPGYCLPEVSGTVLDAQGNPLSNDQRVWIKLQCDAYGTLYGPTGDPARSMQPGLFKISSPDGGLFGSYTLTVLRSDTNPTPLSETYEFKMNSYVKGGQQSNVIFQKNY